MTSLDSTDRSRAPLPSRSSTRSADQARAQPRAPEGERRPRPAEDDAAPRCARRTSPDPLAVTDRYRLTMPFTDEL